MVSDDLGADPPPAVLEVIASPIRLGEDRDYMPLYVAVQCRRPDAVVQIALRRVAGRAERPPPIKVDR